jgi:hypothetical protein
MSGAEAPRGSARVGRIATQLISAHVVFVLLFIAGGALTVWTFARNGQTSVNCFGDSFGSCGDHHSYVLGVTLLVVGFVGNLITMAVGARLAIGAGVGALAYFQRRRPSLMTDTTDRPDGFGNEPPGWVSGQPPGTPGSPTGPPL